MKLDLDLRKHKSLAEGMIRRWNAVERRYTKLVHDEYHWRDRDPASRGSWDDLLEELRRVHERQHDMVDGVNLLVALKLAEWVEEPRGRLRSAW